jgi:hypothetical protein
MQGVFEEIANLLVANDQHNKRLIRVGDCAANKNRKSFKRVHLDTIFKILTYSYSTVKFGLLR